VVRLRGRFTSRRSDKNYYGGYFQATPAMFLNNPYNRHYSYTGSRPFENQPLSSVLGTRDNDSLFTATENWAALVDNSNFGVGIWQENTFLFGSRYTIGASSGRYENEYPCNGLIPVLNDVIDHNIVYSSPVTEFIVGSLSEIRQHVYSKFREPLVPDFKFKKDRQNWAYGGGLRDQGWPILDEELKIRSLSIGGEMLSRYGVWPTANVSKMYIKMAYRGVPRKARLFWRTTEQDRNFPSDQSVIFDLINDGKPHLYEFDMRKIATWKGNIKQFLFAPLGYTAVNPDDEVRLQYISAIPE
jgi:hypothetical protein